MSTCKDAPKPTYMTHLRGGCLVAKTHPLIALRGKLDSLQAQVLEGQLLAEQAGAGGLVLELEEVLGYLRRLLACEVKGETFEQDCLFGMGEEAIHQASHNPKTFCDMPFCLPSYKMGVLAVRLNSLRTMAREVELAAISAFAGEGGAFVREDLLQALNRLSSAFHLLYCRQAVLTREQWEANQG